MGFLPSGPGSLTVSAINALASLGQTLHRPTGTVTLHFSFLSDKLEKEEKGDFT